MKNVVSIAGGRPKSGTPLDGLRREHANMRSVLMLIDRQLDLLEAEAAGDPILLVNALYYMRKFPSVVHHPKEEAIFERLVAIEPAWAAEVEKLREQHREIYKLEDWLIEASLDVPKAGSPERGRLLEFGRHYLDVQRQHSETEERILFPQALATLKPRDWDLIERNFKAVEDPVFGEHSGERFHLLYEYIMREAAGE